MKKTILFGVFFSIVIVSALVLAQQQNNNSPLQSLIDAINNTINNIRNDISTLFQKTSDLQHQVDTIELTPGPQGETGLSGQTGLQGAQGEKGDKGDKGDTGEQGEPSDINVIVEHNMSDLQILLSQIVSNNPEQQASFFDVFMRIDNIKGESTDDKHKEWIEVESFSHGMSNTGGTSFGGGGGAGKPVHQDFNVVKKLDKASPKLYSALNTGEHIKEVIIEVVRAGGDKQKYMEYKMTDVLITSMQISGNPASDRPIESVSLNYAKIEWTYTQTDETGKPMGDVQSGWDIAQNKAA